MRDSLGILLRNAGLDLVRKLLTSWEMSPEAIDGNARTKVRKESVVAFLSGTNQTDPRHFARMMYEAERIETVLSNCLDHELQDALATAGFEQKADPHQRDRILWLWLNDDDEFEGLERRTIFNHLYSLRKKTSQFVTSKHYTLFSSHLKVDAFENEIKRIYQEHDGSGEFVTPYPELRPDGTFSAIAFSLSQVQRSQSRYNDEGKPDHEIFRGLIWGSLSYDATKGALKVTTSQGGQGVRLLLAESFMRSFLDLEEPLRVWVAETVDLRGLVTRKALPLIPGQDHAEAKIVELRLRHPSRFSGTNFTLRRNSGFAADILKRLFGDADHTSTVILAATIKITGFLAHENAKPITVGLVLHQDGGVSFSGPPVDRETLSDAVRAAWLAA